MFPGVAVAARRAAALAAMHPAARAAVDRRRTAWRTAAGTRAAAGRRSQDRGLRTASGTPLIASSRLVARPDVQVYGVDGRIFHFSPA